jgi:hypothetical protein
MSSASEHHRRTASTKTAQIRSRAARQVLGYVTKVLVGAATAIVSPVIIFGTITAPVSAAVEFAVASARPPAVPVSDAESSGAPKQPAS